MAKIDPLSDETSVKFLTPKWPSRPDSDQNPWHRAIFWEVPEPWANFSDSGQGPKMTQNGPKSTKIRPLTSSVPGPSPDPARALSCPCRIPPPSSRPSRTQTDPKWPKSTKITKNGPKWTKLTPRWWNLSQIFWPQNDPPVQILTKIWLEPFSRSHLFWEVLEPWANFRILGRVPKWPKMAKNRPKSDLGLNFGPPNPRDQKSDPEPSADLEFWPDPQMGPPKSEIALDLKFWPGPPNFDPGAKMTKIRPWNPSQTSVPDPPRPLPGPQLPFAGSLRHCPDPPDPWLTQNRPKWPKMTKIWSKRWQIISQNVKMAQNGQNPENSSPPDLELTLHEITHSQKLRWKISAKFQKFQNPKVKTKMAKNPKFPSSTLWPHSLKILR